ncbi:MAG: hypothetical protein ACPGOV_12075 [Magnetovibrionaceae bacterium]
MGHFGQTNARRNQVIKNDAKTAYSVGSFLAGQLVPVAAPITMIVGMVTDAKAIYSTHNHLKVLKLILADIISDGQGALDGTQDAIEHCITKKTHKIAKRGVRLLPKVGGFLTSVYGMGKWVYKKAKGTLGKHRTESATILLLNSMQGDPYALRACVNLLGDQRFLEIYDSARGGASDEFDDAVLVLAEKFKSM